MSDFSRNDTQMTVVDNAYSIMPRNFEAQINEAVRMRDALTTLFERLLEPGKDFDTISGTDKPTLLKSGAELLCKVFKLGQGKADVLDKTEDWERGIFSYTVGMPIFHIESGAQIAYGIGSANSYEKKYRYRKDKATGEVTENADPADTINTLIKMANKRAFVDATLKATGASRMFAQDMEDFGAMTGQYPKPSSNQLGYIKQLFGSMNQQEAFAEISGICGREVTGWDNIRKSEASRIIDAKKNSGGGNGGYSGGGYSNGNGYGNSQPSQSGGNNSGALQCADCGATITSAEAGFSQNKYGRQLCRKCQDIEKASRQ